LGLRDTEEVEGREKGDPLGSNLLSRSGDIEF